MSFFILGLNCLQIWKKTKQKKTNTTIKPLKEKLEKNLYGEKKNIREPILASVFISNKTSSSLQSLFKIASARVTINVTINKFRATCKTLWLRFATCNLLVKRNTSAIVNCNLMDLFLNWTLIKCLLYFATLQAPEKLLNVRKDCITRKYVFAKFEPQLFFFFQKFC